MKHLRPMLAVAIVMLAMAMPSISAAQYHEERLDHFVSERPDLKAQLDRNPNLIYDRAWREKHPALQGFLQEHPNVWRKMPGSERWGAYGPDNTWHESDWWHDHDRAWMWTHHPEWADNHPDWRGDGDFDDHHEWHDRDWWHDHHPDWVNAHHPDWYKHPYEHPVAAEEHKHVVEQEHLHDVEQQHHHDHDHH